MSAKSTYRFFERSEHILLTYTDCTQGVIKELGVLMAQKLREQQQKWSAFPVMLGLQDWDSPRFVPKWYLMILNIHW